jgi:hypothetical protein
MTAVMKRQKIFLGDGAAEAGFERRGRREVGR